MIQTEGEIFEAVQRSRVFADSKTFVDAIAKTNDDEIIDAFKKIDPTNKDQLRQYVSDFFILPQQLNYDKPQDENIDYSLVEYIEKTWDHLHKKDDFSSPNLDTKLALPLAYTVPGGRFRELYYWDTYFTALGLAQAGRFGEIIELIDNFAYLINTYHIIPNGSRSYYLSRSQPPVLCLLVDIIYQKYGIGRIQHYLETLEKEYQFWMENRSYSINQHKLNRYCDPLTTPRPESYYEDIQLATTVPQDKRARLYQALRSAAESGWDFSSRWLKQDDLNTTVTQDILPIDLNALLYLLETKLATYYKAINNPEKYMLYTGFAHSRKDAYQALFWCKEKQCFFDYDTSSLLHSGRLTAAIGWPLFAKLATQDQADKVASMLESQLLKLGGVMTTSIHSGQQWDAPNGWAPLQWINAQGLLNYGHQPLAHTIITRWCKVMEDYFKAHKSVLEKYDVCNPKNKPKQGEYLTQEGFGWSNGVYLAFKALCIDVLNQQR